MNKHFSKSSICPVCFHHCALHEGQRGLCKARENKDGRIVSASYGQITSLALDPIEKKPLYHFHPGQPILSVGSYGCNLSCAFCQNHSISQESDAPTRFLAPEELVRIAIETAEEHGNIGIAFTYNEPLIQYEYILDCAKYAKETDLAIVLVTNGTAEAEILSSLLPFVDAMNIDVKGFSKEIYQRLGGDFASVQRTVEMACQKCHVEITSLIVPGLNDDPEEMRQEARWLSSLDPAIPLHITRCFPHYKMPHLKPTDIGLMEHLAEIAREHLEYVYLGNVGF